MFRNHFITAKAHILCALVFIFCSTKAQYNLVPNPSFEQLSKPCDSLFGANGGALNWSTQIINKNGALVIYGLSNTCNPLICCTIPIQGYYNISGDFIQLSYQYPHTGNGYVGILCYFNLNKNGDKEKDYIQAKLIDSLKKGKSYYVEFWANTYEGRRLAINNIGLLITDTAIWSNYRQAMIATPQIQQFSNPVINDTQNWVKIAGVYKAHGGEKFISIGNFCDNAHTDTLISNYNNPNKASSSYNIDDVSVIPLDSMQLHADAGSDTTINKGDSVWIGSRLCGLDSVQWYDSLGKPLATNVPGLWVKPVTNSYYVITQTVNGYYSTDTVHVGVRQPLPVSVVSGQLVVVNEHTVKFTWVCVNEVNVLHYVVERSVDGRHYEGVGTVLASGAGEYSFLDNGVAGGFYYRLRIVDRDGVVSYSRVFRLSQNASVLPITVFPNPTSGEINIKLPSYGNWQISITNNMGKLVWQQNCAGCVRQIKHSLTDGKGLYFVKVTDANTGKQSIQKVINH